MFWVHELLSTSYCYTEKVCHIYVYIFKTSQTVIQMMKLIDLAIEKERTGNMNNEELVQSYYTINSWTCIKIIFQLSDSWAKLSLYN